MKIKKFFKNHKKVSAIINQSEAYTSSSAFPRWINFIFCNAPLSSSSVHMDMNVSKNIILLAHVFPISPGLDTVTACLSAFKFCDAMCKVQSDPPFFDSLLISMNGMFPDTAFQQTYSEASFLSNLSDGFRSCL